MFSHQGFYGTSEELPSEFISYHHLVKKKGRGCVRTGGLVSACQIQLFAFFRSSLELLDLRFQLFNFLLLFLDGI